MGVPSAGADPAVVPFRDKYYMFVTRSQGYWMSDDLRHWEFVSPQNWFMEGSNAPGPWPMGDSLLIALANPAGWQNIIKTDNPALGTWQGVPALLTPPSPIHDPAVFVDVDGRVYAYGASSNVHPIWGSELDSDYYFFPLPEKLEMFNLDPDNHGVPLLTSSMDLVGAFALILAIEHLVIAIWGPNALQMRVPQTSALVPIGELRFPVQHLLVIGVTLAIVAALFAFLKLSKFGTAIRATSQDRNAAMVVGITVVSKSPSGLSPNLALGMISLALPSVSVIMPSKVSPSDGSRSFVNATVLLRHGSPKNGGCPGDPNVSPNSR